MSKHTPGPWQNIASMPSEGFDCWWLSANGMAIATISGYQGDPECEANARLIAAAPDLLEELHNIANARPHKWDDPSDFLAWAQSRARAAIAKAEGKDDATC